MDTTIHLFGEGADQDAVALGFDAKLTFTCKTDTGPVRVKKTGLKDLTFTKVEILNNPASASKDSDELQFASGGWAVLPNHVVVS